MCEDRWENEGGAPRRQWSDLTREQKARVIYRGLSEHYPRIEHNEMDGSILWKSLESYDNGDIIEHEGKRYRVLYGWHWTDYGPVPVYMAELEMLDPKPYVGPVYTANGGRRSAHQYAGYTFSPRKKYSQNREDYDE